MAVSECHEALAEDIFEDDVSLIDERLQDWQLD